MSAVTDDVAANNTAIRRRMGALGRSQGETVRGFQSLYRSSMSAGALDGKTKELIALAISVAVRCDDCIGMHTEAALKAGASRAEIEEALGVCLMMGGGPAMMYATHALAAADQLGGD